MKALLGIDYFNNTLQREYSLIFLLSNSFYIIFKTHYLCNICMWGCNCYKRKFSMNGQPSSFSYVHCLIPQVSFRYYPIKLVNKVCYYKLNPQPWKMLILGKPSFLLQNGSNCKPCPLTSIGLFKNLSC